MTDTVNTTDHPESVSNRTDGIEVREPVIAPMEADDVDAIEMADALKDVDAKTADKGEPAQTTEPPKPAAGAAAPQPPKPEAEADKPAPEGATTKPVMIPKARLDEVLGKLDEAARQNAYLQGKLDQAAAQPQPAKPAGEPPKAEPTPDQILAGIEAEKLDLAEKYDRGEISTAEWKKREIELDRKGRQVQQDMLAPARAEPAPAQTKDDLALDLATAELEKRHPYSTLITEESDWAFLEGKARQQLVAAGEVLDGSARAALLLRTTMAQLTDTYGPHMTGKVIEKPATKPVGQQQHQPSGTAAARGAKLTMADGLPPDINNLGGSAASSTEISEADILGMTDEDIAALPEATRRRILKTAT
ncbi:hypothetical protein [Ferrovibrio sp.]|uniref:hypothetical protein n=1 Tax=Ferrovibrio sp. TaxID=1917215 RepID=UPI00311FA92B